jgi:hypothetical protein
MPRPPTVAAITLSSPMPREQDMWIIVHGDANVDTLAVGDEDALVRH